MAYTGRLRPKGAPFSGFRYIQYRSNVSWQSLETRTTRLDPRSSKLEYFEYRVSSRVVRVSSRVDRVSSRVVRVSSRGDKECNTRLIFQIHCTCVCKPCWFTFGDRNFRVATLEAVSDTTFVNRLAYWNRLFCPSVELESFDSELIMVHFRVTVLNTTLSFVWINCTKGPIEIRTVTLEVCKRLEITMQLHRSVVCFDTFYIFLSIQSYL